MWSLNYLTFWLLHPPENTLRQRDAQRDLSYKYYWQVTSRMAAVICVGHKVSTTVAYKTDGGAEIMKDTKKIRKWNLLNKKEEEKKK